MLSMVLPASQEYAVLLLHVEVMLLVYQEPITREHIHVHNKEFSPSLGVNQKISRN